MKTKIEWTEYTWNFITGCDKISSGCKNCYAEKMSNRLFYMKIDKYKNKFKVTLHPEILKEAYNWRKSRMVFVNSMSDLFHKDVPDEFIIKAFNVMADCPQHTFQVLTKRAERLLELSSKLNINDNIWIGTSVENQENTDRIDFLKRVEAKIKFISFEPLIGRIVKPKLDGIDWIIAGGECISEDSIVSSSDGYKAISDINPGDIVYSFTGNIENEELSYRMKTQVTTNLVQSRVLNKIFTGFKEIYLLKTKTRRVEATAEHRFLKLNRLPRIYKEVIRYIYNFEWVQLKNLQVGDFILIQKGSNDFDVSEINKKFSIDFMRIVGLFIGDGWVTKNALSFAMIKDNPNRKKYIPMIENEFQEEVKIDDTQIHIYRTKLAKLFDLLGLNKKELDKNVPSWVWDLTIDHKKALIEGYLDSDGCVDGKHKAWRFEAKNKQLITDIWSLCLDVGYHVTSIHKRDRIRGEWIANGKVYNYPDPDTFYYFKVSHKRVGYKSYLKNDPKPITKGLLTSKFALDHIQAIELKGKKKTFDLQIENHHNYIANGIVVHNSGPGARPMKKEWVLEIHGCCKELNIPFFFKQWGGVRKKKNGNLLNGKIYNNMPEVK